MNRFFTPGEAQALAFLNASIGLFKSLGAIPMDADPFVIDLEEADSNTIDPHDWPDVKDKDP